MSKSSRFPHFVWQVMNRLNRVLLSRFKSNSRVAGRVLVLITIGRKSGQLRSTPLQYEQVDGVYYVGSARGTQADWYRNLVAHPRVDVQVGELRFCALARLITDPAQIADFLEIRKKRHPRFMGIMLRLEGLPRRYTRLDLEKFLERLVVVALEHSNP